LCTVPATPTKPGRNDSCPCGSGRKYKACCAEAEARFCARQTPDVAEWLARARQSVAAGRIGDAEFWFRQVLTEKSNDAEALAGVGQALCWRRRRREGREYLRKAAKQLVRQGLKNRDPSALLQLSGQLQHWGDMEAALDLARLGVRLAPESAVAQNNLALCLSRVNRVGEALPPALRACELLPGHPGCQILVALLDKAEGRLAAARERLERAAAAGADPEQTARAWLELGAVLDKQQEYDAAFEAFRRAAELHAELPATLATDRNRVFASLARHKAGFDRDLLHRFSPEDFADSLPAPCFLFGFLRSGTTLAEQVLGAHPEVIASDENDFVFELTQELARQSGIPDDIPAALRKIGLEEVRALRKLYWQRVAEEYGDEALRKRFVDKLALNSIDAGFIAALFPEAKILFALRDPRDVVLSCFQQAFSLSPATVNLLSFEGIARQYAAVMDFWLYVRELIAPEFFELRYEDTVGDFEATFRRVFALLGVGWRPEVLSFHERAKGCYISTPSFAAVSQPLYQTAVARWRRYERHVEAVLPILQPYIAAFGYETP
jgi:tetratricopeptide (TPR) repeat protein